MWKATKIAVCSFLAVSTLAGGFLAMILPLFAEEPDQAVVNNLNSQIDAQRAKIDELTAKINEYSSSIKASQKASASLNTQVSILNNQIGKTNLEISLKEAEAEKLQLEIEQTNNQILVTQQDLATNQDRLADIIRLIGRYEDRDEINILLANDSFSDFYDQLKYSTDLQEEMQRTANRIKENAAKLADQKTALDQQKAELDGTLEELDATNQQLTVKKADKNLLLAQTKQSEKKYQALLAELKAAQSAANSQVAALEKQLRAELAKKGSAEKYNSLTTASLIWPTATHRITATFHDPTYPYISTLGQHSGLDLGVAKGTPVMAADDGYVAKVAVGTKWYGTYIMIIHGGSITTLYAHLNSALVAQDQYVTQGQVIGYSGNTGFSSGPHLHFEVRSNGVAVDPQAYLP